MKINKLFLARISFVFSICLIFIGALGHMNKHFDRLSRYPYDDEEKRALIDQYLDDDAIEYIIEYSIEPSYFIDYITYSDFNIYHVDYYNEARQKAWFLNNEEIVSLCEFSLKYDDGQAIVLKYLPYYNDIELKEWLVTRDPYIPSGALVLDPGRVDLYLNDTDTLGFYIPYDLNDLSSLDLKGFLRKEAYDNLNLICADLADQYGGKCGYLNNDNAYISYTEQLDYYQNSNIKCLSKAPGHSEHQTGLAIDLNNLNADLKNWLVANSYRYGFVLEENHFRYVSKAVAVKIHYIYGSLKNYNEAVNG